MMANGCGGSNLNPRGDEHPSVITSGHQAAGPLTRDEPFTYLYPEWDFRAGAYRHHWCRVRERVMDEGTSDFYIDTLAEYRRLVGQVSTRFEHFFPELFRKVTRRYDGEDIDLDPLVDRLVDRSTGEMPREKDLLAARSAHSATLPWPCFGHERDDR